MKIFRIHKAPGKRHNQGFSLVELIISIAILAIVMIPIMSNFFRSMQLNKRAENLQAQGNLASNIMEGLKTMTMDEILNEFNGDVGNFDVIENEVNHQIRIADVMRLNKISGGYEEYPAPAAEKQATYYFAINGVKEGGTAYDALITMDSVPYDRTDEADPLNNKLNDFPMPDIVNLDEKANCILLSVGKTSTDTIDDRALNTFIEWGKAYAEKIYYQTPGYLSYLDLHDQWEDQKEENEMGGSGITPTPVLGPEPAPPPMDSTNPDYALFGEYLDNASILSKITKTMKVLVNKDTVTYQINYHCDWRPDDINKDVEYPVSVVKYPKNAENIYMLYTPSIYTDSNRDVIDIKNQDISCPVNLFTVEQSTAGTSHMPFLTIKRQSAADNLTIYVKLLHNTDADSYVSMDFAEIPTEQQNIIDGAEKTEKEDRIYDITVNIYEYAGNASDKYRNLLYTLNSTKEE